MKPLLSWAGNKNKHPLECLRVAPGEHYFEPFAGSLGSYLAFNAGSSATLSDSNHRLILFHRVVQREPDALIAELATLPTRLTREGYLELRREFNTSWPTVRQAALLLWLNKACFNGLYRENSRGDFNVPMGDADPVLPSAERIHEVSRALRHVSFFDFAWNELGWPHEGTIYLDPPYLRTFSNYTAKGFTEADHRALAERIRTSKAKVILSNSDTPLTREIYGLMDIRELNHRHAMGRRNAKEIIATWGGSGV